MGDFQRGKVTKVTFEIEYPDGSTKTSDLDNPGDVEKIVFSNDHMADDEDAGRFNVSEEDWKQNPTMLLYSKNVPASIPFCTHNGCKG